MLWGILVVLVLGGGAYAFYKKSQKSQPKQLPKPARTLTTLRVNDIVTWLDQDFLVEGKLVYSEDGDEWYDFRLVDGDEVVWLAVEDDDELETAFFRMVDDLSFTSRPPEEILYEGVRYRQQERGTAQVTKHGKTGKKSAGTVKYFEYEAPGGKYLSVEQWGENFEVSVGEEIRPSNLEILPGDEVSDSEYL